MKVKCEICGKSLDSRGLHKHMLSHGKQETENKTNWECKICGAVSDTRVGIVSHVVRGHKRSKKKDGEQAFFKLFGQTRKKPTLVKKKQYYKPRTNKQDKQKKTDKRPVIGPQTKVIEIPVILQVPVVIGQAHLKGDVS